MITSQTADSESNKA